MADELEPSGIKIETPHVRGEITSADLTNLIVKAVEKRLGVQSSRWRITLSEQLPPVIHFEIRYDSLHDA